MKKDYIRLLIVWTGTLIMTIIMAAQMVYENKELYRRRANRYRLIELRVKPKRQEEDSDEDFTIRPEPCPKPELETVKR